MAAAWQNTSPVRPSSRWQSPGILFNVELGVLYSPEGRSHTAGLGCNSRRMEERVVQERREIQYVEDFGYGREPSELQNLATLGALLHGDEEYGEYEDEQEYENCRQQRNRRFRAREQYGRGMSAPPDLTEPTHRQNHVYYIPHIAALQHTRSMPSERADGVSPDRTDQPLPSTTSKYRLGAEDLPWSSPIPEYLNFSSPSNAREAQKNHRNEDPQRAREMDTLHQAMMTIDTMGHNEWEPWADISEMPRGLSSIGWAVRSQEQDPEHLARLDTSPYSFGQWENARSRSAYS